MATITEEQRQMIRQETDYVFLRRYHYSVDEAIQKFPDGLPTVMIAKGLGETSDWVESQYRTVVGKIRGMISEDCVSG